MRIPCQVAQPKTSAALVQTLKQGPESSAPNASALIDEFLHIVREVFSGLVRGGLLSLQHEILDNIEYFANFYTSKRSRVHTITRSQ